MILIFSLLSFKAAFSFSSFTFIKSIFSSSSLSAIKVLSSVYLSLLISLWVGFPCSSAGKESTCNAGDLGLIPGLGRSPGEGKSCPLQYSGLENSMDYVDHGVAKSRTRLNNFHFFLPTTLIPSCASSSPAFRIMCSAYKLNRQGDNIQP